MRRRGVRVRRHRVPSRLQPVALPHAARRISRRRVGAAGRLPRGWKVAAEEEAAAAARLPAAAEGEVEAETAAVAVKGAAVAAEVVAAGSIRRAVE